MRVDPAEDVAFGVDGAPPGPPGHLIKVPRFKGHKSVLVKFTQFVENDAARGHVDPQREGFRRENHLDEARGKKSFDHFFQGGQHSGVVISDAALDKRADIEGARFGRDVELAAEMIKEAGDFFLFIDGKKIKAVHFRREIFCVPAAEGKIDAGQKIFFLQVPDQ